ncbi:Uncharacterized protein HZ326_18216 [Fusarium oxysporum f. sp. albedinis]|nr:Uncharacterized protein HZ326_18216 [Fusarium oxysporum f. sp. albedinis]
MEETKQDKPRPAWKRFQLSYMNRMTAEECYNITRRACGYPNPTTRVGCPEHNSCQVNTRHLGQLRK